MKLLFILTATTLMSASAFANTCAETSPQFCTSNDTCRGLNKSGQKARFKFEDSKCLVIDTAAKSDDCIQSVQSNRDATPRVPAVAPKDVKGDSGSITTR